MSEAETKVGIPFYIAAREPRTLFRYNKAVQPITTILSEPWELAERLPRNRDLFLTEGGENIWIPAQVPGHVHSDLQRAGVIADPFWRLNEQGVRWVDEADWTYRTTFTVEAERLALRGGYGKHYLDFGGLDTLARVYLNGTQVGASENFFVPLRLDVTDTLREGENELRIEFDSALRVGRDRAEAYLGDGTSERGRQAYFNFAPRAFLRKPQYMFGWDWGPELVSCGIWQPVELVTVPVAEIVDWRMDYTFTDPVTVDIRLALTVDKHEPGPMVVSTALYAPGDNTPSAILPDEPGRHTVEMEIRGQKVAVWNPNGLAVMPTVNGLRPKGGPRKRYFLNFKVSRPGDTIFDEAEVVAFKGVSVGFRTVEVIQEPDADGKGVSFGFRVNGVKTFIKGANWIPDGSFPGQITEQQLRERLTQAREAGFNMLRVWGGGLYESDTFYNLCDELGILVWQDFALACSMYPDDDLGFVENVRQEAAVNVRRLRHHPCLALWCGGNENVELFQNRWSGDAQATRFYGAHLIHEVFPAVLADEDTRTSYWPNSPYSGTPDAPAQDPDRGDAHFWGAWHNHGGSSGDWVHYAESDNRFSSEFGFASPAGMAAWGSCTVPEDRNPRSLVSQFHNKTRKDYDVYLGYIEKHFPKVQTWEDLVYYGQANQAEALRFGVEHWRRRKERCGGTLFWQLNDCWPTHSWAVIDSFGEPKAAYYAAKRFYAPLLLSLVRVGDTVEAHLIHDPETNEAAPPAGTLDVKLSTLDGATVTAKSTKTMAPQNGASGPLLSLSLDADALGQTERLFVDATFADANGAVLAQNVLLLNEPNVLQLPNPNLQVHIENVEDGTATLTLSGNSFAPYTWLRFEGVSQPPVFSENWLHLRPGQAYSISVSNLPAGLTADDLRARLRVRSLAG